MCTNFCGDNGSQLDHHSTYHALHVKYKTKSKIDLKCQFLRVLKVKFGNLRLTRENFDPATIQNLSKIFPKLKQTGTKPNQRKINHSRTEINQTN